METIQKRYIEPDFTVDENGRYKFTAVNKYGKRVNVSYRWAFIAAAKTQAGIVFYQGKVIPYGHFTSGTRTIVIYRNLIVERSYISPRKEVESFFFSEDATLKLSNIRPPVRQTAKVNESYGIEYVFREINIERNPGPFTKAEQKAYREEEIKGQPVIRAQKLSLGQDFDEEKLIEKMLRNIAFTVYGNSNEEINWQYVELLTTPKFFRDTDLTVFTAFRKRG